MLFFQDFGPLLWSEADQLGLDVRQSIALKAQAGAVFAHGVRWSAVVATIRSVSSCQFNDDVLGHLVLRLTFGTDRYLLVPRVASCRVG